MKKVILLIISFFTFTTVTFAKVEDVNYDIKDYIVEARIDISGNMVVKEVIEVKGSYNGYIRDLAYKNNNLGEFTNDLNGFSGSSIYNATSIEVRKVGAINHSGELTFDVFNEEVNEFSKCSLSKLCYEETTNSDGVSLKMYNETHGGSTYFYIEYLLGNVVVLHNDVAELYFNFIGEGFDDNIENYQLRVVVPNKTTDEVKVWAHGPLTGEVSIIEEDGVYYGGYLKVSDLESNTPVDMRMTFSKDLIMVDHPYLKKSGADGLSKIIEVETERADTANKLRNKAKIYTYGTYGMSIAYIILTILIYIYI